MCYIYTLLSNGRVKIEPNKIYDEFNSLSDSDLKRLLEYLMSDNKFLNINVLSKGLITNLSLGFSDDSFVVNTFGTGVLERMDNDDREKFENVVNRVFNTFKDIDNYSNKLYNAISPLIYRIDFNARYYSKNDFFDVDIDTLDFSYIYNSNLSNFDSYWINFENDAVVITKDKIYNIISDFKDLSQSGLANSTYLKDGLNILNNKVKEFNLSENDRIIFVNSLYEPEIGNELKDFIDYIGETPSFYEDKDVKTIIFSQPYYEDGIVIVKDKDTWKFASFNKELGFVVLPYLSKSLKAIITPYLLC